MTHKLVEKNGSSFTGGRKNGLSFGGVGRVFVFCFFGGLLLVVVFFCVWGWEVCSFFCWRKPLGPDDTITGHSPRH